MKHRLALADIQIGGKTQQRAVDDTIVKEYMDIIDELPPIEVMTDGNSTWLTDGFHRYHAYRKLGKDYIEAVISEGTKRDAIWKSFTANVKHGFRRQPGTSAEIVRKILADKEWGKTSLSEIARHVGVSQPFVSQVKKKVADEAQAKQRTTAPPSGNRQSPPDEPPEPVLDAKQREVPEHLRQFFLRGDEIKQHITYLNQMVRTIKAAQAKNDLLWANCKLDSLKADVGNLRRALKFSLPYAVCVYCGGSVNNEECTGCNGHGFLNERQYVAAPKEMKE